MKQPSERIKSTEKMDLQFDTSVKKFTWHACPQERELELMTQDTHSCTVSYVPKLLLTKFAHINNNQEPYQSAVLSSSIKPETVLQRSSVSLSPSCRKGNGSDVACHR